MNNKNNWEQHQKQIQDFQNKFRIQNTTSYWTRFGIVFLFGWIPQFILAISVESMDYGMIWIIGLSLVVGSGIFAFLSTKLFSEVKSDVIIPTTSISAAMLAFSVFLPIGDGIGFVFLAIFMAFVFYIIAAAITWIILFISMIMKLKDEFIKQNPNFQEAMKNNQRPRTKKDLDSEIKQQGIDLDALDEEYGSHFDKDEAVDVEDIEETKEDKHD